MGPYVEPAFRVDVYLDTNILVDYIEGNYKALTDSIDYLANTGYVNFRTSQYVLYEFSEVRKYNLFYSYLTVKTEDRDKKRNQLKYLIKQKNWEYNGVVYDGEIKSTIEQTVRNDLRHLMEDLELDIDKHILHKNLFHPSLSCVLKTSISKEDSIVLTSCVIPNEDSILNHCILLSGDKGYGTSFHKNEITIRECIGIEDLNLKFIKSVDVRDPLGVRTINLREPNIELVNLQDIWNNIICSIIIEKNIVPYIGKTYNYKNIRKCNFFEISKGNPPLKRDVNLVIIPKDLSFPPIKIGSELGIRYYDELITTPHIRREEDNRELKYSF